MKTINTKTTKKIAAIILASATACQMMGCSVEKTVTNIETHTDENGNIEIETEAAGNAEIITYDFETFDGVKVVIDESNIVAQEASEDPQHSELISAEAINNIIAPGRDFVYLEDDDYYYVADIYRNLITVADKSKMVVDASNDELPENPGYFETDSWSIKYDTDKWYGYVTDKGSTIINYIGECAGTSLIEIIELDVDTAKEAVEMLEEKTGKKLTISDDIQTGDEYSCFVYEADKKYEPDMLYIDDFYTIHEHDGKVIILNESITHDFDNDRAEELANEFVDLKNALVLK